MITVGNSTNALDNDANIHFPESIKFFSNVLVNINISENAILFRNI